MRKLKGILAGSLYCARDDVICGPLRQLGRRFYFHRCADFDVIIK